MDCEVPSVDKYNGDTVSTSCVQKHSGRDVGMPWHPHKVCQGLCSSHRVHFSISLMCPYALWLCPFGPYVRGTAGAKAQALYRNVLHRARYSSLPLTVIPTATLPVAASLAPKLVPSLHPPQVSGFVSPTPSLHLFYDSGLSSLSISSSSFSKNYKWSCLRKLIKVSRKIDSVLLSGMET